MNLYHLTKLVLNTFALLTNNAVIMIIWKSTKVYSQIDMVLEKYFNFRYGFEQMDKMSLLASTLNKVIRLYFLNNIKYTMKTADISTNHLNAKYLEEEIATNGKP